MKLWKTESKRMLLDHSKFLKVEEHTVLLPDGRRIENWAWVIAPDYVLVLPRTKKGTFLCFKQTKYAVKDSLTLATIGGYLEPMEDPLETAKRELREEMGAVAENWVQFGGYPTSGNNFGGMGHLFLAEGVEVVAEPILDDLEEMERVEMSREEMEHALLAGEFKVLSWSGLVALVLTYLSRKEREKP